MLYMNNRIRDPLVSLSPLARSFPRRLLRSIHEAGLLQVLSEDDVLASVEHDFDVARVGGARDVVVDGAVRCLVLGHELAHKVLAAGLVVVVRAVEVGEGGVIADVLGLDLLLKQVALVEEQDERRFDEKCVVANVLEQIQRLHHAVGGRVLEELLVVLGDRRDENDGRYAFETVDPFLPLVALDGEKKKNAWLGVSGGNRG